MQAVEPILAIGIEDGIATVALFIDDVGAEGVRSGQVGAYVLHSQWPPHAHIAAVAALERKVIPATDKSVDEAAKRVHTDTSTRSIRRQCKALAMASSTSVAMPVSSPICQV